ncbi:DNA helicase/exodeoxyribonuclease V, subunit A [Limimonas halophila]|uniref:DNA 3'-5' helicase n=1 Tax=Limimonas halophila TaxID=1082479 RepID=A0A1G7U0Y0_9PROT|nr:double-strand break repair helicase AddA [Limimonas halophila]SDG41068.1 DNA helicase/exodeoxyribonuclease V, subunit A [Limimonas halophila]
MTGQNDPHPDTLRGEREARAAEHQRAASDPDASAWVTASAGTGKTKVLTDRVLNLLLAGTEPERVLCLTFTKAAAAEMRNRLAERLAAWAVASDAELTDWLTALTGETPDASRLRRARELFARVLDTAGGMKIQTIHAFCQTVLARFPLEAGVPPHFQVMDERSAAETLQAARESVLLHAGRGDPRLADALAAVTAHAGESGFDELLGSLLNHRSRLVRLLSREGGVDTVIARIFDHLGVHPEETPDSVRRDGCAPDAGDGPDEAALRLAVEAMKQGTAKEAGKADGLRAWLDADAARRAERYGEHRALFLTQAGEVRSTLLTKAAREVGGAQAAMEAEAERLLRLEARMNAATVAHATTGLLRLGAAVLDAYHARKRAQARMDYDDLVLTARDLLSQPTRAAWVLFKLDNGLDHVLIDEAQDTSPEQWDVVQALTAEFFAGEGAREAGARSVFAVGDAKQSIYSFQRADPAAFARMHDHFAERARDAEQAWRPVNLQVSFRATDAVLSAVDAVFARPDAAEGVVEGDERLRHDPVRVGHAGRVELWPTVAPAGENEHDPWQPPDEPEPDAPPATRLARLIAARIAGWVGGDPDGWLAARGRQMQAGDVLVLVRRRTAFMGELVRALKQREVPVAGVDRMVLTEQLAVRDLVALGRFLLLPEDDLTLACVLKGPLIALDEDALFALCHGRKGTLWDALRDRAGERADFERAFTRLNELLDRADFVPPHELFARILGAEGGRAAILARLGAEANEAIDEFMQLALAYEREHVPSLEGFLHWLEAGAQEVKREAEHAGNAVRIMTVHGAKGLQAPVVILPDTTQPPEQREKLLWDEATGLALWPPKKAYEEAQSTALREAAEASQAREYRRLLYVAMTRAEDRLYVTGWRTNKTPSGTAWYDMVAEGLADVAEPVDFDFTATIPDGWTGEGLRLDTPQRAAPKDPKPPRAEGESAGELPDWARTPPAAEPRPPRPLAPSQQSEREPPVRSPLQPGEADAFQRGRLVHRLLQTLPDLPPDQRGEAADRFLADPAHGLSSGAQRELRDEVLGVVNAPRHAHLFGPGSHAEVPVVGLLDGREPVSGQVDRLVVTDTAVVIVDYKTNRPPPAHPEEVSEVYRRQLGTYARLLEQVYPRRRVETWLLWTDGPTLMPIEPIKPA